MLRAVTPSTRLSFYRRRCGLSALGEFGTRLTKVQQAQQSSQARGVRLDLGPLVGKHAQRLPFLPAGTGA